MRVFNRVFLQASLLWLFSVLSLPSVASSSFALKIEQLSDKDYQWVAERIFENEANQNLAYLTFWSAKEAFPSLGIGHFIWIPEGVDAPFVETFPEMVAYVSRYSPAPTWLQALQKTSDFNPPWQNRAAFQSAQNSQPMRQLRQWLLTTQSIQARFITERLWRQLAELSSQLSVIDQQSLQQQLNAISQTKKGLFALIDYSNFKGLGLNDKETYKGEGWGLLNVLLAMPTSVTVEQVVPQFVLTAKKVLQNRVKNARPGQNEAYWLPGWFKRVEGYLNE